jgi:PmbA protein
MSIKLPLKGSFCVFKKGIFAFSLNYTKMIRKGEILLEDAGVSLDIAASALSKTRMLGAETAEVFLSSTKELNIEVRNCRVETLKRAEDRGLGIRVMEGGRVGFSFTSDLTPAGLEEAARQSLANCARTAPDPFQQLPESGAVYPCLDLYDPRICQAKVEEKINLAIAMEEAARAYDSRVKIIENAFYQDGETLVAVVNTAGMAVHYRGAFCGISLALVAGEGEESQTGFAFDFRLKYEELDPESIGREAASRAVRMLGARPVATRQAAVVLEPYVAGGFLGLLGPALTGEAVQKGRSLFAGKVGSQVAARDVTVIDDGTLPGGIASAPFDGEGVPTSRTVLVNEGFLQGFLHNTYTAAKDGMSSTGNGVRSSFKGTPEVGATNFFIQPGLPSPEELIKEVGTGLYVTDVLGMHTANPISGDFSLGVAGLWIENGEFTHPVRGVAIAGNIVDLLMAVDGVGNDLKFYGGKGAPTLRLTGLTISGQ